MSMHIRHDIVRDATADLNRAFRLSNFCRELAKAKIIPGTQRTLGEKRPVEAGVLAGSSERGRPRPHSPSSRRH